MPPHARAEPARRAFSLVELIVVLAIISALMALLLPAIQRVRETANALICKQNYHEMGVALHAYHNDYGAFPVGCVDKRGPLNPSGRQLAWSAYLMPYLEQDNRSVDHLDGK